MRDKFNIEMKGTIRLGGGDDDDDEDGGGGDDEEDEDERRRKSAHVMDELAMLGASHSLFWMLIPFATVFTKLAEAVARSPLAVIGLGEELDIDLVKVVGII